MVLCLEEQNLVFYAIFSQAITGPYSSLKANVPLSANAPKHHTLRADVNTSSV